MSSEEDNYLHEGSQDEADDQELAGEGSQKDSDKTPKISLTNFLFGNVNKKGQLETDFLDEETKRNLASLETLGVSGRILSEIVTKEDVTKSDESDQKDDESDGDDDHNKADDGSEPEKNGCQSR